MKKKLLILSLFVCAFVAMPVLAATTTDTTETVTGLRQRIQEFKTARTEQKEQLRTQIVSGTKDLAVAKINRIIARYQTIRTRVQNMTTLSAEQKTALTAKIDAEIATLQQERTQVQASSTSADIKNVMNQIRTRLRNGLTTIKEIVNEIHVNHLNDVVTKLTGVLKTLTDEVAELKTSGKDVAAMETLETDAQTKLDAATAKIKTADFTGAKADIVAARLKLVELAQQVKAALGEE